MGQIDKESLDQRIKNLATKNTKEEDNSDISISAAMEQSLTDPSKTTTNITTDIKPPKPTSSNINYLNDLILGNKKYGELVDKKITSMGELQTQLKDAIKADKTGTKESRNRSNELSFWRSLLVAGEAVGSADPTKGFMNALAKGATAGGKSLADARNKIRERS